MKKMGYLSIQRVLDRAKIEFMNDDSAPSSVTFDFNGRTVRAVFSWSYSRKRYYVSRFFITYSRCVMEYFVLNDYGIDSALCW